MRHGRKSGGATEDQLDLEIGDTAVVESTIGMYEITLNSVEVTDEIEGQMSELDEFMIVHYTIRNIGEDDINAEETIGNLELTDFIEGGGMTDISMIFDEMETFSGELAPGEDMSAEAAYYTYDAGEYYIRVNEGLVGSGGVYNQIQFTFQKSEVE